jgi:CheY-like chemotaxis protein
MNNMSIKLEAYDLSKISILTVDDNPFMRLVLRNVMSSFGVAKCWEAKGAADGIRALEVIFPDIIFCEWDMAPVDGLEFVKIIRTDRTSPHRFTPIVMLGGYVDHGNVCFARDAGIHEYLIKPYSASSLYKRVVSIIENPRVFIQGAGYLGPDRRRNASKSFTGEDRRKNNIT